MFYFGARLAQGEVLVFNARLGYPVFVCDSSDPLSANDFFFAKDYPASDPNCADRHPGIAILQEHAGIRTTDTKIYGINLKATVPQLCARSRDEKENHKKR